MVTPPCQWSRGRLAARLLALAAALVVALLPWLTGGCGGEERAPVPPPPPAPGPGASAAGTYDSEGRALAPVPAPRARPNLILVVLDTLRADALDVAQPERGVMPWLAGLGRSSVAFTQASAPAPWTLPSMASLLNGLLPGEHRQFLSDRAPPSLAPLTGYAEVLAQTYGYETTAFPATISTEGALNIWQGFATPRLGFQLQGAADMLPPWAASRDKTKPFFLVLHTYELHDAYGERNHPYPKPERPSMDQRLLESLGPRPDPAVVVRRMLLDDDFRRVFRRYGESRNLQADVQRYFFDGLARRPDPDLAAELHDAYRAGARWVDGLLERAVALLGDLGLLEGTLLVITSDHGEAFGEHGALQHQRWLYDELLRVPLVMKGPPPFDQPRLVTSSVGLIDVLPTFFDWAGMVDLPHAEGRSLLPIVSGGAPGHVVRADEVRLPPVTGGASHGLMASARSDRWKYVVTHELLDGSLKQELYELTSDPAERVNRLGSAASVPPVDAEFARAVELARDRIWDPRARLMPSTPPPSGPRPPPLAVAPR